MTQHVLNITAAILAISSAVAQEAGTESAYRPDVMVLYNPLDEFALRAPNAMVLGSFIKQLDAKAAALWKDQKSRTGKSGLIAVAMRPERRTCRTGRMTPASGYNASAE